MKIRNLIKPFSLLVVYIMAFALGAYGQGSCVITSKKVSSLGGQVVSQGQPVSGVSIELRLWTDDKKTIETASTDDDGFFQLKNKKKAKYVLYVSRKLFAGLEVPVYFAPSRKNRRKRLVIHLASDYQDPCADGGAELVDRPL